MSPSKSFAGEFHSFPGTGKFGGFPSFPYVCFTVQFAFTQSGIFMIHGKCMYVRTYLRWDIKTNSQPVNIIPSSGEDPVFP